MNPPPKLFGGLIHKTVEGPPKGDRKKENTYATITYSFRVIQKRRAFWAPSFTLAPKDEAVFIYPKKRGTYNKR